MTSCETACKTVVPEPWLHFVKASLTNGKQCLLNKGYDHSKHCLLLLLAECIIYTGTTLRKVLT